MANGLHRLVVLCALSSLCSCSSDAAPDGSSSGGVGGGGGAPPSGAGQGGASATAGTETRGGMTAGGTASSPGGSAPSGGGGAKADAGASGNPPPAVDGRSIYALECHGDSKDCHLGAVPCFGVGSPTPNVAAGWACANRCTTNADCSSAPTGAEAQASCVPFTSAGHCVLVCQNENQSFACPNGMTCYTPPKSPVGYCLWQ